MSYASTTPRVHVRARVSVPILDAESAELKAERLWGMADARKPCSLDSDNVGVSQVGVCGFVGAFGAKSSIEPTAVLYVG